MNRLSRTLLAISILAGMQFGVVGEARAGLPPEVPDAAYGEGSVDDGNPRVETRLIADRAAVESGGTVRVGVHFAIDPDWHIYWRNSGDAGMSTKVRWKSDAAEFGDLQWPAPHAKEESGGEVVTFGYSEEVVLFSEASVSEEADGELEVSATVDYLACKVDCIPGAAELTRTVEIGESEGASEKVQGLFETYAGRVPQGPEAHGIRARIDYSQEPIRPGDTFRAGIGLDYCGEGPDACRDWSVVGDVESARFIPDTTAQVSWKTLAVQDHPSAKEGEVLVVEGRANSNEPNDDERLSGVVWLEGADGETTPVRVEAPVPRGASGAEVEELEPAILGAVDLPDSGADEEDGPAATAAPPASEHKEASSRAGTGGIGFWQALLFAFLGGIILNLMPCVFPVLALKVTSFAELVHEDRSHALLHGAAYAGGIVGSMLVLAGVVLGLRSVGTEVGWGFQFQNPIFPAVLAAVVVAFAMNLFGVFEIQVQASSLSQKTQQAAGLRRSVGEGILAVVLATPCSAPFLGTAVGFALTGSAATVIVLFSALGLGLAAPFVVLMLVPGWSEVLPDPGPWMVQIRKILGFVLLGAAIWLIWIAGRTVGVDGMTGVLVFLGVVAFAVWVYGAAQEADWGWIDVGIGAASAAAIWAAWVLVPEVPQLPGISAGRTVRLAVYLGLAVLAFGVLLKPVFSELGVGPAGLALGGSVVASVAVGSWALDFNAARAQQNETRTAETRENEKDEKEEGIDWGTWSEQEVDGALEEGRPVFVDFTADWCITCKVNERTVLSTRRVREAFDEQDVATLKADWTNGGENIQNKLKAFGKGGVPMYLVYSPDAPEDPELLPEVLTPERVVAAVREAGGEAASGEDE